MAAIKIDILCVGKLKEGYYSRAQAEYIKMLGRFCDARVVEVMDEPDSGGAKRKEGEKLLKRCSGYVVACDMRGKKFTSEGFSKKMEEAMNAGAGSMCFVVGGSNGLSDEVLERAALAVSFSDMTMPHRLFRIVLLEQIYRAFKIMRGETYHK